MNPYIFSALTAAVFSLVIGLYVLLKDRHAFLNRIFCFYSSAISFWAFLTACHAGVNSQVLSLACARAMHVFVVLIPVFFLHFIITLLGSNERSRFLLRIMYAAVVAFAVLSMVSHFIVLLVRPKLGYVNFMDPGSLYPLLLIFFTVNAALGFLFLLEAILKAEKTGAQRKQYNYLLWSSLVGYLMGASSFFPVYDRTWFPYPYGCLGITFYIFTVAFIAFKYGFFDLGDIAQAAHRDKLTAIGVLAASINHEVKNPLFIIKGLAESCLERQKEGIFPTEKKALESANDAFKRTMEQADRAMDIIRRLSLFAKAGIDSEIKFEPVNISSVLEDILPLVRYELAAHSIVLTRDIPKNLPEVQADRRYFEEILFNLIVNACQAIKETGRPGEIRISATLQTPGVCANTRCLQGEGCLQDRVLIKVEDTGPGIPADKLKDVFRPFYTTKAEGTGLGLYITKQLVEKIKGRIDVRSEVGAGTIFTVDLQLSTEDREDKHGPV